MTSSDFDANSVSLPIGESLMSSSLLDAEPFIDQITRCSFVPGILAGILSQNSNRAFGLTAHVFLRLMKIMSLWCRQSTFLEIFSKGGLIR